MKITLLAIHCSATPDGRNDTAEDIHRWHQERGWDGIGYHYVIELDGTVQKGRPDYWKGAHVGGHNSHSIGICLIGTQHFTRQQHEALEDLLRDLQAQHPEADTRGHYELDARKTCPNIDVPTWLKVRGLRR